MPENNDNLGLNLNLEQYKQHENKFVGEGLFNKNNLSSGDSNSTKSGTNDQIELKGLQNEVQQKQESSSSSLKPKVMTADEYYGPKLSDDVRQNGGLMHEDSGVTIAAVYYHEKIYGFTNKYALEISYAKYEEDKDDGLYEAYIRGLRTRPQDILSVAGGEINKLVEELSPEQNETLRDCCKENSFLSKFHYDEEFDRYEGVTEKDFGKFIDFVKNLEPREIIHPTTSRLLNMNLSHDIPPKKNYLNF